MILFLDYFNNSSIFSGILSYLSALQIILSEPAQLKSNILDFDNFQFELLKVLTGVLFFSILSIFVAWNYYGDDIYDHFIKSSNLKEIEELKASVSKLKLPQEHTPRI